MASPASALSDATNAPTATKRTHEEEELTPAGHSKKTKVDILSSEARHLGRTQDAFMHPGAMINSGVLRESEHPDAPDSNFTPEANRWFRIYNHLKSTIPHFEDRIAGADDATFAENVKLFKTGLSAARSDDIASLKGVVVDWLAAAPYCAASTTYPLPRNSKGTRGFHNPVIGQLLCPSDLDWEDEAVQQGLRDGTIVPEPSQWPNFLFENGHPQDPDDLWAGLFRHPLLVKTVKHIYTSPSSVEGTDGNRATRASKAALHGMRTMTVGAIADAAVKLRHTLSSSTTFQKSDKTTHNEVFYYGLLEILEAPRAAPRVNTLLAWYNAQVFPGQAATAEASETSALAKLRAQLAAEDAAAAT